MRTKLPQGLAIMEHKIKVSIIVPIYNVEKYLGQCLDSIINQKLKDIEIICVDDGSKDNSLAIVKKYALADERIKIITKPNSGYGNSMNRGMDAAQGEYIGIVESDDYVDSKMFYDLYNLAVSNSAEIVKSDYYEFSTVKKKVYKYINTVTNPSFYNRITNAEESVDIFHFRMNTWTGIYKTSFIRKNCIRHNETPGASYQDNGFWFQTLSLAKRIYFTNKAYYYYRQDNPNSSINNKGKVFCMCDEFSYIRDFIDNNEKVKDSYLQVFLIKKYFNYFYTYKRIADEYKIDFLKRFAKEFNDSYWAHEFDENLMAESEMIKLWRIMRDPVQFYYDDTLWCLNDEYLDKANYRNYLLTLLEK